MHLPSGTKRVITLPAIAMVFALLAAPVHAQHVVTTNEMYPITGPYDYTPTVPCGCSGPSDAVNLRGVIHMMVQAEPGPTGIVTMQGRSDDHACERQSHSDPVCRVRPARN